MDTDISEEPDVSIFRIEEGAVGATCNDSIFIGRG
jgi:hypothetical protein